MLSTAQKTSWRRRADGWLAARGTAQVGALSVALMAGIGLVDHLTGYELAFSVFYLLPVGLAAWYAGRPAGMALALASAATWLLVDFTAGHPYTHAAIPYWNAGVRLGFFVIVAHLLARLRDALTTLHLLANHDGLTGLLNARAVRQRYALMAGLAARQGRPMALAYLDVDGFKGVNDTLGHAVGDAVLQAVAATLSERLRATDVVGRIGGDEFVILLPQVQPDAASSLFEGLRAALASMAAARDWPVGFSIGVTVFDAPPSVEAAFAAGDQLMYRAKRAGGNRVVVEHRPDDAARPGAA